MLRSCTILLFLVLATSFLAAQDTIQSPGTTAFSLNYQHGFIIAHRPSIVHLQRKHVNGFELSWLNFPRTSNSWFSTYNFPLLGITFQYFNLGNEQELGSGYALMPEIIFPVLKHHPLRLTAKLGIGAGYIEKPFNVVDNYKNLAIGSHLNCAITTGLQVHTTPLKRLNIFGGIQFTHFSNGAARVPNLGLNITTLTGGMQLFIGDQRQFTRSSVSPRREGWQTDLSVAAGIKQIAPPRSRIYHVIVFNGTLMKDVSPKSMLGGGLDIFADSSIPSRLEADSIVPTGIGAHIRSGIFGAYGLHVGKCTGLFQTGVYIYSRLKDDGIIYSRLAIRYYFNPKFFACFNLKSHFAKADTFEWGIGYSFRR